MSIYMHIYTHIRIRRYMYICKMVCKVTYQQYSLPAIYLFKFLYKIICVDND